MVGDVLTLNGNSYGRKISTLAYHKMQKLAERWDYDNKLDKLRKFACLTGK